VPSQYGELHNMVNFSALAAEISCRFGAPQQISVGFVSWFRYYTNIAERRSTKHSTMFGRVLGSYTIYTFLEFLTPNGILPDAKFTLRPSFAFSYIGSVTAWHSSCGRQPNFAAFSKGCHLYLAGRPSCWVSAHILSPTASLA